ncbi:MAG: PBECR4 domain-containing protein [Enterocloster sp.]
MDKLLECTRAFEKLLDTQYRIIIGRKGKMVEIIIGFSRLDFHHLMGLGKLKDLRIAKQNRETVFNEILRGIITYEGITESRYLGLIQNRFEPLMSMEQLLDDNRLVFRYNTKLNQFSLIEADYLLSTPHEGKDIYIFIAKNEDSGTYYCRSFFPKERTDYTKGQAIYTMLSKEKICLSTGEKQIQYDRLTPKR